MFRSFSISAFTALTLSSVFLWAAPSIQVIEGELYRAPRPEGRCGASSFGYTLDGTYVAADGRSVGLNQCLESVSIPIEAPSCIVGDNPGLEDPYHLTLYALSFARGNGVRLRVLIHDLNESYPQVTLLGLEKDCER